MARLTLSDGDGDRVAQAVAAAEAASDGEIVTVLAAQSDRYHDTVAHLATIAAFLVAGIVAAAPGRCVALLDRIAGGWDGWTPGELVVALMAAMAIAWLAVRALVGATRLRVALTPAPTRARRVRRRAVLLFRLAAENRTRARTGVLLYLSLAEQRAEIVADRSIDEKVDSAVWGEAMAALLLAVKDGRPADGMIAAVARIGTILAEHFPRSADDTNELPDRLILL